MGYFSNGTEGERYEMRYCERCIHGNDDDDPNTGAPKCCPVWLAHLSYNSAQYKNEDLQQALELLIPREGPYNAQCAMFVEQSDGSRESVRDIADIRKRIALLEAKRDELFEGSQGRSRFTPELRAYVVRDTSLSAQVRLLKWALGERELP